MPDLSFDEVGRILALLRQVGDADVELEWGDLRIEVRRGETATNSELARTDPHTEPSDALADDAESGTSPARHAESPTTRAVDATSGETPEHWRQVSAPMAGTFYRSPKPGEPPYVQEGDAVTPEDSVALIEVMKLFTELKAGVAGRVARIDGEDSALVEHEQPLLWIEPV